jgi:thiamine biosynthesis protein ThiS
MTITVNGKSQLAPSNNSISSLLDELGFGDKPVVVEHNKIAIFPRDYSETLLSDGDSVEIITIAAGG